MHRGTFLIRTELAASSAQCIHHVCQSSYFIDTGTISHNDVKSYRLFGENK